MIELLSPAGNMDCLKAAVQNGANSVYFGGPLFNARASATNFTNSLLEEAISYAKIRNVKTNLTLNTVLQDSEFEDALSLAKYAYEIGIDAIIVQDIGLAKTLINYFPDLPIHASTQMSVHNLEGALFMQDLGFKRVVLARELSLAEIEHISKNCKIETECFVHGALCISYSGQCLFSSMVGGRSGNRGKCAQPCRLPYTLIKKENQNSIPIDNGHLLSPHDLCGLPYLPDLVSSGVSCLKIEGRMKPVDYVGTVTRIYRKYLDLAQKDSGHYLVDDQDKKDLLQVFNRGGFSSGHLLSKPNTNLIYKEKPSNMGLYLGNISHYQKEKGIITLTLNESVSLGDSIGIEGENSLYTISELMQKNCNIPNASIGQKVQLGRMKGNITVGLKVFKMKNKQLCVQAEQSRLLESKKIPLAAYINIEKDKPITLTVDTIKEENSIYPPISITTTSSIIPEIAQKHPITKERIYQQLNKTNSTPYFFRNIDVQLGENLYISSISAINELRRTALSQLQEKVTESFKRISPSNIETKLSILANQKENHTKISLLLNKLNSSWDYSVLKGLDHIYIPLNYFLRKDYDDCISKICNNFHTYVYFPTIMKSNYRNLLLTKLESKLENYPIKGFVLSNLADISFLNKHKSNYEWISNFTFNVTNSTSINTLKQMGFKRITLSPELNKENLNMLSSYYADCTETIVYGNLPIMNLSYCLLGKSNKCYPTCSSFCKQNEHYLLKDRYGELFPITPDSIQTVTTIYNSKITALPFSEIQNSTLRVSILNEDLSEIQNILNCIKNNIKLEGKQYTYSNYYRNI